jgi:hypothetical protein
MRMRDPDRDELKAFYSMADTLGTSSDSDDESNLERFLILIPIVVALLVVLPNLCGVTRKTKAD